MKFNCRSNVAVKKLWEIFLYSMFRLVSWSVLLVLSLATSAPSAAEEKVLIITPRVKAILDDYLKEPYPLALAVSPDGSDADYVFCTRSGCNIHLPVHQRDAINYCGQDCVILAVGREIKLKYQVAELPPVAIADLPLCRPGPLAADFPDGMAEARLRTDTCTGFSKYVSELHFKAFAVTDISAPDVYYGWAAKHRTVEAAIDAALGYCRDSLKGNKVQAECRLYAIGNIVVYDLQDAALRAATDAYRKDRETLNADLPPG